MILAALSDYYDALSSADADLAPYGWSRQKIGFVVVLNEDGTLHGIEPAPATDEEARKSFSLVVPGQSKPSGSGINPCFLWDNATYMLGWVPEGRAADWAMKRFEAFRQRHVDERDARGSSGAGLGAVASFLESWSPQRLCEESEIADVVSRGFGVFRLRRKRAYVHEHPEVVARWNALVAEGDPEAPRTRSLVSGEPDAAAILHKPKIKGVRGAQSSGALLVSFNFKAVESFSKEQGLVAPVGERDAFRYCTALNRLLADPRRRALVAGTTAVFWAKQPHAIEDLTGHVISGAEDPEVVQRVQSYLDGLRQGISSDLIDDPSTPFFVLGLAPNISRLSVRFWLAASAGAFASRLARHAMALELGGQPDDYVFPTIRRIVAETAPPKGGWPDESSVSPVLTGEVTRAVLGGLAYPRSLLVGVVRRMRSEGIVDSDRRKEGALKVMHRRMSIVKACLLLGAVPIESEVPVSLQEDHESPAYQLGRLFAVIEKTQVDALGLTLNATIRDRYLAGASATPSVVFPRILRLHMHHLGALEHVGQRVNFERLVGSIMQRVDASTGFPANLTIEDQGLFFLGYYQQRQDLYTSKKPKSEPTAVGE